MISSYPNRQSSCVSLLLMDLASQQFEAEKVSIVTAYIYNREQKKGVTILINVWKRSCIKISNRISMNKVKFFFSGSDKH